MLAVITSNLSKNAQKSLVSEVSTVVSRYRHTEFVHLFNENPELV